MQKHDFFTVFFFTVSNVFSTFFPLSLHFKVRMFFFWLLNACFLYSQDREVFNLQAKIDEMTREREHLSKENDHIMNEVHCVCALRYLVTSFEFLNFKF